MKVVGIRQNAEAVYELAHETNKLNDYVDLSLAIINVFNQDESLKTFLTSTGVDLEEKKKLIADITNGNDLYKNWLFILLDQGKSKHIRDYIEGFIKFYNKKNKITEGIVWSAQPLEEKEIKKLEVAAKGKLEKEVSLMNKIDKEIIGGVKLEIEDNVWDNTVKTKLVTLLKGEE